MNKKFGFGSMNSIAPERIGIENMAFYSVVTDAGFAERLRQRGTSTSGARGIIIGFSAVMPPSP